MITAAAVLAVDASAQEPSRTVAVLVFLTPGVPISLDTIQEWVTKNTDGSSATVVEKAKCIATRVEEREPKSSFRTISETRSHRF
ncbi:MAG: hypothetical protein ABI833_07475 [Acidobacteriota bacterium]